MKLIKKRPASDKATKELDRLADETTDIRPAIASEMRPGMGSRIGKPAA